MNKSSIQERISQIREMKRNWLARSGFDDHSDDMLRTLEDEEQELLKKLKEIEETKTEETER